MTVKNDLYDYGLKIYQDSDYFKFSLDSILLAEFVQLQKGNTILDLCTGNAPIPLILCTKVEDIRIDCVEIQKEIFDLGKLSIEENQLTNKIHIENEDAKVYRAPQKYDIVTCNPPYFKVTNKSEKNANEIKRIARHEICITLKDVIEIAKRHLKETGTFYLVERVDRLLETVSLLERYKLGTRKICFVYTGDKNAEFFLLEASNYKKADPKIYSVFTKDRQTYKDIFKEV